MPEPVAPVAKKKRVKSEANVLSALKKKYRLDMSVRLKATDEAGKPLGRGPLLAPEVFDKFASLDTAPDKRYLDWMLYQAGGGPSAVAHSLEMWGEDSPEVTPEKFLEKFNREVTNRITPNDVQAVVKDLADAEIEVANLGRFAAELQEAGRLPTDQARYQGILQILNAQNLGPPDKRERIARELLSHKIKAWIRDQLDTKVRDRVHAIFVFNRLAAGMDRQVAENEWKANEATRKREYIFGDQDSLRWRLFGFNRFWPGKEGRYEKVYDAMKDFLVNKTRVENRNSQLERYNAAIAQKNATLPPDQQLPEREPINIDLNIGKVTLDRKDHLKYTGPYDTIEKLQRATDSMTDLPMRERVSSDIRYAGPKGKIGHGEKIYSDQWVDAMVPMTVAAAVKSGHPSWQISDPEQLDVKARGSHSLSTWSRWAAGEHHYHEWAQSQIIPVFFILKTPQGQPFFRVMLMVFLDDLVQLEFPYLGTLWRLEGDDDEVRFPEMVNRLKRKVGQDSQDQEIQRTLVGAIRGIRKALRAIKEWGQEFDPSFMVGDYVKHHREKMAGRRGLREEIQLRAAQIVELLTE